MKLLATDMDGTFLRDDKSYSEEFNDLYKQMLKKDIQFVIASGNQYEALVCKFDDDIKDDLYYLCENGMCKMPVTSEEVVKTWILGNNPNIL